MRPSAITRWDLWLGGAVFVAVLAIGCAVIFLDALTPPWRNASILVALIAGCVAWRLPKLRWRFMSLLRALGDRVGVGEPTKIALPWIVDGDTIDDLATGIRYRFANIDAPETGDNAKCHNERLLGERTKNVANEYVRNARVVAVRRTWRKDIYGRVVAYVEVDGQDLGELLAKKGYARRWHGRRKRWCGPNGPLAQAAATRGETLACRACAHWRP